MPLPAALGAAAKLAPAVISAGQLIFGRRKKPDYERAYRDYQDYQPTGRLNPEDYAAAEETRTRLAGVATNTAKGQRMLVQRRYTQRGLGTSPAQEASLARVGEQEAVGREGAGMAANEQLYNVRRGREVDAQNRAGRVFSARIGQMYQDADRESMRQTAFMNSLLEYLPNLKGFFGNSNVLDTNDGTLPGTHHDTPDEDYLPPDG